MHGVALVMLCYDLCCKVIAMLCEVLLRKGIVMLR